MKPTDLIITLAAIIGAGAAVYVVTRQPQAPAPVYAATGTTANLSQPKPGTASAGTQAAANDLANTLAGLGQLVDGAAGLFDTIGGLFKGS